MNKISDVKVDEYGNVTGRYKTEDPSEVNVFKRALMYLLETYAIDVVVYYVNTSSRSDEIIALRLGQLVIDNTKYDKGDNYSFVVDVSGPKEVTTEDFELPFKFHTPIVTLLRGQRLHMSCHVIKGTGLTHVKWRPISAFGFNKSLEGGYEFSFRSLGMMDPYDIIRQGLERMNDVKDIKETSIFSKLVLPL